MPVDPVKRLTKQEVENYADKIAKDLLKTTRGDAFRRLELGQLNGSLAEPELRMLYDMLKTFIEK